MNNEDFEYDEFELIVTRELYEQIVNAKRLVITTEDESESKEFDQVCYDGEEELTDLN